MPTTRVPRAPSVDFDVWGCRGSRGLTPGRSAYGTRTSCYSLLGGEDMVVFDAGSGLAMLGAAISREARFSRLKRVWVLLSHAHMDHWEGLKDVDWFWRRDRPLAVTLFGTAEALQTVARAFEPPSYVPLRTLVSGGPVSVDEVPLRAGDERAVGPFCVRAVALHHYSGEGATKRVLDAVGFQVSRDGGPVVSYISDHEPPRDGGGAEETLLSGADLALGDAHFARRDDERHGHGSQEFWASAARAHPRTLVVAGHLGPLLADSGIREAASRHGRRLPNFVLAREGDTWRWNARERRFGRRGSRG